MSDIDYGCNAENPLDAIAAMLDSAPQATFVMRELEALGFKIVRAKEIEQMLEALSAVAPLMIPGMNWTDETGQLVKEMVRAAIAKAGGSE